jgi:hypothetical protein
VRREHKYLIRYREASGKAFLPKQKEGAEQFP